MSGLLAERGLLPIARLATGGKIVPNAVASGATREVIWQTSARKIDVSGVLRLVTLLKIATIREPGVRPAALLI